MKHHKVSRPTLLGELFFALVKLLLLALAAWIVLFIWFIASHDKAAITSAALLTIKIIIMRIQFFIALLPSMLSVLFVFFVDGLVQRDIRKFQAARESAFFFHRAKSLAGFIFYAMFFIDLAIPKQITPAYFLISMTILCGIFMMFSIQYFKKYV